MKKNDLHTTPLGVERIRRNMKLSETIDVVNWCRDIFLDSSAKIERKGKNLYVTAGDVCLTINAHSGTIITAHRK